MTFCDRCLMFLKRVVAFFITRWILFADSGQRIDAHTCFKSNITSYILSVPKSCCSKTHVNHKTCVNKKPCCSVTEKFIKQVFVNHGNKTCETITQTAKIATVSEIFKIYDQTNTITSSVYFTPPLPSCKGDICFTQVFRI